MKEVLFWAVGSTVLVSLIALIGIITLIIKQKLLDKITILLVGLSAGALMGSALIHLLPEALESSRMNVFLLVLIGFCFFFLIERLLFWRHCHKGKCDVHTFTYMSLIGDGIHNFIDGIIITASYMVNIGVGIVTTIAIISHEIPQELGDFGVLIHGGFKKSKALLFNFLTGFAAVLGAIVGYILSGHTENFTALLIPFAAGGFIYVAASDLIPELHKEKNMKKSMLSFAMFLVGIISMALVKFFGG